jgi:NAD(P)H dehydrogenase (quinone)
MIVVTGATGQLGQLVIQELLRRTSASEVVAGVRHPENADGLAATGVTVRLCDYDQPATLDEAFNPGDRVLLISGNDFARSVDQHAAVVEAARINDVSLLAYTSLFHANVSSLAVAQPHARTEPIIRESGLPFVMLRNNLYTEHFIPFVNQALQSGTFFSSMGDGRVASATRNDLAAAAATVLTTEGHENSTYELSGDVAWTSDDLVNTLSAICGIKIRLEKLSASKHSDALVASGFPPLAAKMFVNTYEGIADGELAEVTSDLTRLIDRHTATLAETLTAVWEASKLRGESLGSSTTQH